MHTEIWIGLIVFGLALIFYWMWSIVKVDRQHARANEILVLLGFLGVILWPMSGTGPCFLGVFDRSWLGKSVVISS